MATVEAYSTGSGRRYMVRYRKPGTRTSTKKRGFTTKRDAELFAATVEVSKARGEFVDATASRAPIGELGPAWLDRRRHLKPSTMRSLATSWRVHVEPRWGRVAVADVSTTDVQAWVTDLASGREATGAAAAGVEPDADGRRWLVPPKSATVVGRAYGILASVLDDAVRDRRASTNHARGVTLPRKARRPRTYLTHDQVEALAEQCGEISGQYRTLVYVLAYCGLRWGEATGLRVRSLDMLRRRLAVEENAVEVGNVIHVGTPKTHERRSVPFPRFLAPMLARQCEGKGRDELVFVGPDGEHLHRSRTTERGWFAASVRRADVPHVTPHDLRHTAASLAVSAGANVKAVQRMLGHASAAMTLDVYADLFDDDLEAVATALDDARTAAVGQ
ncbi:tyrosine-type recombinase/integrase [Cellulosimicrobium sp. RS]|uniref:tyrosine-type recombinase/integrase n=1 Tax=Cellulosimicrobium sp. RS TaxID=3381347 RepID=UPI0038FC1654